jgi:hypothetical protein
MPACGLKAACTVHPRVTCQLGVPGKVRNTAALQADRFNIDCYPVPIPQCLDGVVFLLCSGDILTYERSPWKAVVNFVFPTSIDGQQTGTDPKFPVPVG